MRRVLLLAGVAAALSGPAWAVDVVIDPAAISQNTIEHAASLAKQVAILENGLAQLVQIKATLAAVAHGNLAAIGALGPELGMAGLSNPFSGEGSELMQALGGLAQSGGTTAMLASQLMQTDTLYIPSARDFAAAALTQGAMAGAAQKAMAQRGLEAADARLQALTRLREQLDGTAIDAAGAGQATARLAGEAAVGIGQTNQLLAADMMTRAQAATREAQAAQRARQDADAALASTQAAADALGVGRFARGGTDEGSAQVASVDAGSWSSDPFSVSASVSVPSATTISSSDALTTMQGQSWGSDAIQIAEAQGVNPDALAATCVIESNCRNVAGTGSITGPFQMTASTQSAAMRTALATNPDLASYAGTSAAQAVAASQELKNNAIALQGMGVQSPTLLQARALYQWGAGAGPGVALAGDGATMGSVLPQYTAAQLAANGVSPSMTVGAWRSSVAAKLGPAAYQPVLTASST